MDAALLLAENIAKIRFEDIPPEVVETTKMDILDTLGVILAASTSQGIGELVELLREGGDKGSSTVIAYGDKFSAWSAAFANGSMGHCLDYDDLHPTALVHTGITTIPAALAIAERRGNVSGKEFITAVTLGNEVNCRMGLSTSCRQHPFESGWTPTCVMGCFGAATAAAKLLQLDKTRTTNALGIAYAQACGGEELAFSPGSILRGMRAAFPSKAGVLAALMAERGITGPDTSLEGKAGLFNLYFRGNYDRSHLIVGLGKKFEAGNIGFKPWPSCANTHPYIDAALQLIKENNISPESVKTVTVFIGEVTRSNCEPLKARQNPSTAIDAKFSIPFTVGVAIAKGAVKIDDFSADGLKDSAVLSLSQKVISAFDSAFNYQGRVPPGGVEIEMTNGNRHHKRVDISYGQPENPIQYKDLVAKFRDCAAHSVKRISQSKVESLINLINGLESARDVAQIARLVS